MAVESSRLIEFDLIKNAISLAPVFKPCAHDGRHEREARVIRPLYIRQHGRPALTVVIRHEADQSVGDEFRHIHAGAICLGGKLRGKLRIALSHVFRKLALRSYRQLDHFSEQNHCTSTPSAAARLRPSIFASATSSCTYCAMAVRRDDVRRWSSIHGLTRSTGSCCAGTRRSSRST